MSSQNSNRLGPRWVGLSRLSLVAACLVAGTAHSWADDPLKSKDQGTLQLIRDNQQNRVQAAQAHARKAWGQDPATDFTPGRTETDPFGQTHVHLSQSYKGVPVLGEELIVHVLDDEGLASITGEAKKIKAVDVKPGISAHQALAAVHTHIQENSLGDVDQQDMAADLMLAPDLWFSPQRLIYRVQFNPAQEGAIEPYLMGGITEFWVDAQTGKLWKSWSRNASGTQGTGHGAGYGTIPVNFEPPRSRLILGYMLHNPFTDIWIMNGRNATYFTAGFTAPYVLGDGKPYKYCSGAVHDNAGSDAVDIYQSVGSVEGLLRVPLGRSDSGLGRVTILWDSRSAASFGTSFTASDGSAIHLRGIEYLASPTYDCNGLNVLGRPSINYHVAANVVAHELGHVFIDRTANFNYYVSSNYYAVSEGAGLHEGNAQIMEALAVRYRRQGGGTVLQTPAIGADDGLLHDNYFDITQPPIGAQLYVDPYITSNGVPLAYWTPNLANGGVEVHAAGLPAERFFYYLSMGASTSVDSTAPNFNQFITMNGIGLDSAFRIWFRGMSVYCTSGSGYRAWAGAMLSAAKDLYGDPSSATAAVRNAAQAIGITL